MDSIRPAHSATGPGSAAAADPPGRDGEAPPGSTVTLTAGPGEQETERGLGTGSGEEQPGGQEPNKHSRPLVAVVFAETRTMFRIDTPQTQVRYAYKHARVCTLDTHTHPHAYSRIYVMQSHGRLRCYGDLCLHASVE